MTARSGAAFRRFLGGAAAAALVAGCGTDNAPTTQETRSPPPPPADHAQTVVVYLLRGEHVAPVARTVAATKAVGSAAVRALLGGPTDAERRAGFATAVPRGSRLRSLAVRGGVATIDLSRDFESGGGSLSMTARVAQVVHTLTRFASVRRVAFRLDGRPVTALGGEGVVVSPPVRRADFEDQAPAILVESPLRGRRVTSPLRFRGTANTFEAVFIAELRGSHGTRLVRRTMHATSGTGTRGTFDVTLRFRAERGAPLELLAYEASPADGRPMHRVRVPLVAR